VVFDKTGTLTAGRPQVRKIIVNHQFGFSEDKILKIAASVAKNSEHPLSKAVYNYALEKNAELKDFSEFKEIRSKGIIARCQEHDISVALGNIKFLKNLGIENGWAGQLLADENYLAGTKLFVVHGQELAGAIVVADEVRPEAHQIIRQLKKMGMSVAMITGDNQQTARSVAQELAISKVLAEVLPEEKSAEIKKLQAGGAKIIFVGDGINDAPSLVQADLGIAMGSATDIAKEAGQIILMQNNLKKMVEAVKISKNTFKTIRQNLFWAFFYNVIAIPLAISGILNPAIAAGAMAFSSVSVVLNSLRIYKS